MGYWLHEPENIAFINWVRFANWKSPMVVTFSMSSLSLKVTRHVTVCGVFLEGRRWVSGSRQHPLTVRWDRGNKAQGGNVSANDSSASACS